MGREGEDKRGRGGERIERGRLGGGWWEGRTRSVFVERVCGDHILILWNERIRLVEGCKEYKRRKGPGE